MDTLKNIGLGIVHGMWDSICGMTLVLYIDEEINRQKAEREEERKRRSRVRTPSPVPSSAAAMMREEELRRTLAGENPDERSLESMRKKAEPTEKKLPFREKKIAKQVLKCCLLNGGFTWLSIILFEQLLLPMLKFVLTLCYGSHTQELHLVWGWLQSILSIIFGMMWVLPIFLLSKIVSSLWFADIANAAYQVRKGRPQLTQSLSKLVADFLFSIVVQMLFLMQSMIVNMIPFRWVGGLLCFVHMCLLYSLYSFEYKWFNMGWELHRRLSYIENNWPYFLGFGIPLTILTNMTNSVIVSSCIFSIFFPLFILSGNEAKPIVGTINSPLRLFSPVIFVSNLFFNRSRGPRIMTGKLAQQQPIQNHRKSTSPSSHAQHQSQHRSVSKEKLHRYSQPPPLQPQLSNMRQNKSTPTSALRATAERKSVAGGGSGGSFHGSGLRPLIPTTALPPPSKPTQASTGGSGPYAPR